MPIYRCSACGFVGEVPAAVGEKHPCAKCATASTLFDTPFYVQKLTERYIATRRELDALKLAVANPEEESSPAEAEQSASRALMADDLSNTNLLATEFQHRPLHEWFAARHIGATFVLDAVDTTGYFDEAAREIGEHHAALGKLVERVRFAYRKEFSWINVDLSTCDPATRDGVLAFSRQLYGNTLFSRYHYKKQTHVLGLGIQPAVVVREFFLGAWLEWFALGTLLQVCVQKRREFSCARNVTLALPNAETRELDVVVLVGNRTPVIIECKTGEFRTEIGKYAKLRQRLGLDRTQFIICNPELPDDQLAGLGSMYDLTFVNLGSLRAHLDCMT